MHLRSALIALLLLFILGSASAQTSPLPDASFDADGTPRLKPDGSSNASTKPWEDYGKFIHKRGGVTAIGPDGFGDAVSLYNGALSFSLTDISVPGNSSLPVALTRTFSVSPHTAFFVYDRPLGDWDLDLPRISGVYGPTWPSNRCSNTNGPSTVMSGATSYPPQDYWQGLQGDFPGGGELLLANQTTPRPSTGSYVWLTPSLSYLSCLPTILNGSGEGFVAITADGTRYTFDWMAQYYEAPLASPSTATPSPTELQRAVNVMYATRVEDRFGHWVTYTYANTATQPARLSAIQADDGRSITLTYNAQGKVQSASSHGRTWTYAYNAAGSSLTQVTLPDSRFWTIDFKPLSDVQIDFSSDPDAPRSCDSPSTVLGTGLVGGTVVGTVTHPAGATAEFEVKHQRLGRSNVPKACVNWSTPTNNPNDDVAVFVRDIDAVPLARKTLTGVGLTPMQWTYDFFAARTWAAGTGPTCQTETCADPVCLDDACAGSATATVIGPDSDWRHYTFGNSYRYNEGKLRLVERGTGPTNILQRETTTYNLAQSGQAFATPMGHSLRSRGDGFTAEFQLPRKSSTINRDGVNFVNAVNSFDAYARPTSVTRASSLGFSRSETTSYYDDLSQWVIGQLQSLSVGSTVPQQTVFDPATALPAEVYAFGQLQQRLTYHSSLAQAGLLYQIYDASNLQKTTLDNYYRGLPQSIVYHDLSAESAVVNDRGDIDSVTDALGNQTCYAYDPMGRLTTETLPSEATPGLCNTSSWNATQWSFTPVATAEYGIASGHWRLTQTTGAHQTETFYDGLWRPILSRDVDLGQPTQARFTRSAYDAESHIVFSAYPGYLASNLISYTTLSAGVTSTFDVLSRPLTSSAESELGALGSSTEYLTGFRTRSTNPRGFATETTYQAFDQPSTDAPMQITAPATALTSFTRDTFGKPLAITRSGQYTPPGQATENPSLTRRFVYDNTQRLCKTIEPESGATVVDYDAANNPAWRALGSNLTGPSCDRASVPVAERSTFTYDARNRVTLINHPAGTEDVSYSYFADGALHTASTQGSVWTYAYNRRRLPISESLTVDGQSFNLGWSYDANASVTALSYPSGLSVGFNPNALGEPRQVGSFASTISRHRNGAIAAFNYGNTITHSSTQNTRGLPLQSRDALGSSAIVDTTLSYDENANPLQLSDGTLGAIDSKTLTYDGLDRLTAATAIGSFGTALMEYDPLDNLRRYNLNGRDWRYVIDASSQRLSRINNPGGVAQVTLAYDSRGNTIARDDQVFTFDRAQRLLDARLMSTVLQSYRYDAHGRRTASTLPNGEQRYQVYSRSGQLLYEALKPTASAAITRTTDYVYLGGSLIAKRRIEDIVTVAVLFKDGFETAGALAPESASATAVNAPTTLTTTISYLHTDPLGSPVAETNTTGTVIERTRYEPYGNPLNTPSEGQPSYTGHPYDAVTDLIYAQQRYYDPRIGRFLSVDPVGASAGSFNRYNYAANSPYRFIDPDGRQTITATTCSRAGGNSCSGSYDRGGGGDEAAEIAAEVHHDFIGRQADVAKDVADGASEVADVVDDLATDEVKYGPFLGPIINRLRGLFRVAKGTGKLIASANRAINETGLSRAAQKLSSHAQRSGGTFPKPTGGIAEQNAQAERVLRGILESPQATRTNLSRGGFEFRLPNGQGARFDADGSFNTFLDPRL